MIMLGVFLQASDGNDTLHLQYEASERVVQKLANSVAQNTPPPSLLSSS